MLSWLGRHVRRLNVSDAPVCGVETFSCVINRQKPKFSLSEETFSREFGNKATYYLLCIRLYISGSYDEPLADQLPPPPRVKAAGCCAIL